MENLKLNQEDFTFVQLDEKIHDTKFKTKPVGYLKDAWNRFKKNKASVLAAIVILLIVLYGLIYPFCTDKKLDESNAEYSYMRPRNMLLEEYGIWDGTYDKDGTIASYAQFYGIGVGSLYRPDNVNEVFELTAAEGLEYNPVKKINKVYYDDEDRQYVNFEINQYYELGFVFDIVSKAEYQKILQWQEETGIQMLYPLIDTSSGYLQYNSKNGANYWYMMNSKGYPLNESGKAIKEIEDLDKLIPNYLKDKDGNVLYTTNSGTDSYNVRVLRYARYLYNYGEDPSYVLGSDGQGYDIAVRLAYGIRLSLLLAICVSVINLVIGAVYGAIEGYYGGTIDIIMERISDILANVPSMVVISLFNIYLVETNKVSPAVSFVLAFIATGWLGTAYRVRTQFYRFKGQEYVLAARTLGAKDFRLMFKHIFPNSLGTIITSSVLVIPGVIFSETSLSYLGIIDLNGKNASSIGTMLANGQACMKDYPHVIIWPAVIIALLMLSFNLFGNGLRDAFNPSLRGVDD